jgi:cell wall-associated NlpC family hydrolase
MVGFVSPSPQFQAFMNYLPQRQGVGFNYTSPSAYIGPGQQLTTGQLFAQKLSQRASQAQQNYTNQSTQNNMPLASDILNRSANGIQLDQYFQPRQNLTDFSSVYNNQLQDTRNIGNFATQAAEARNAFAQAVRAQNMQVGNYINNLPAGATPDNIGAQAVAIAKTVVKNGTPYQWGGNSLKTGVDCSGLIQQIYGKLGIKLPRVTYEQAKSGKVVNRNQLLPGDLIFYNTGSRDPNGIGRNGHVALYIGNGQVIEAAGRGTTVHITNIDYPGQYSMAVRPW